MNDSEATVNSIDLRRHLAEHHYAQETPMMGLNERQLLGLLMAVHESAPEQGGHPQGLH